MNGIEENLNNIEVDIWKKIKEYILDIKFLLGASGIGLIYLFYQFGYAFLYGYYFVKDDTVNIAMLEAILNPIPFNFKSIAIVGIMVFFCLSIFFVPLIIVMSLGAKKGKLLQFGLCIISAIFVWAIINIFFSGISTKNININININIVAQMMIGYIIVIFTINLIKLISFNPRLLVWICFSMPIIFVVDSYFFDTNTSLVIAWIYYIVALMFAQSISNRLNNAIQYIRYIKRFLICFEIVFYSLGVIDYIYILINGENMFYKTPIMISAIVISLLGTLIKIPVINFKIGKLWRFIKCITYNRNKKKVSTDNLEKYINIQLEKEEKEISEKINDKIVAFLAICIFLGYMIVITCLLYQGTIRIGTIVSTSIKSQSYDTITYAITSGAIATEPIKGKVVAQNGNTYYISTMDKELVTIKSAHVITTPEDTNMSSLE